MRKRALFSAISLALATGLAAADEQDHHEEESLPHGHHTELETLTVRALPIQRSKLDSAQPVDIMAGEKLDDRRGKTLGETLMAEPGVHSTAYGAGASRPIIRGLSGPRVRVLEDGLATADTAAQSDDHAVTVDPMLIDRIEILRGPATLLYGSGAVGGVVNIIDNRIPERVPTRPLEGRFELRGDTVANERSGVLRLDGGDGNFAWHLDGTWRDAGDYKIPGEARLDDDDHDNDHDHEDDGGHGRLENSFVETQSGTIGASWIGDRGFFGASFRAFENEYGVPAPHDHDNDHDNDHEHGAGQFFSGVRAYLLDDDDHENGDEEEFVFIDMQQRRWDLKGGLTDPVPGFSRATLRMSYNDYRHRELPLDDHDSDHDHDHDQETFTEFDVDAFQARLELEHEPIAGWRGAVGVQFDDEDLQAEGAEAFVPDGETRSVGLFALEEKPFGDVTLSAGARVERTTVKVHDSDDDHDHDHDHEVEDIDERSFTAWSASLGGVWQMNEQWQSSLNYSRAQRAPSQTELFANGPHLATFSFERGNPALSKETTNGWDLIVHRHSHQFDFEASVFYNDIRDFIFLEPTGHTVDGLPERETRQEDAEFYGFETEAIWHLEENGFGHFDLRASFDTVRGKLDDGRNLPRISPTRVGVGVDWHQGDWRGNADFQRVRSQDRVAEFETETAGYNMLSAQVSYYFDLGGAQMEAFLRGNNLLDEEARVHTSFLKNFAPLPGRNFTFGLRGNF